MSRNDDEIDGANHRMSFLDHLDELRKRLIASVIGIGIGCAVSFAIVRSVFRFVMVPLQRMLPDGGRMITTYGPEYFMLHVKVGLIGAVVIAAPWIVLQFWLFIAPGLYAHEKRFAIPFVLTVSLCFFGGVAFGHYVAFPVIWRFFVDFGTDEFVIFMPRVSDVFSLYVQTLLGLGLIFQMPAVVFALTRMRVITARFLVRQFKYAVLIIAIVGAAISPGGDPSGQLVMGGPMLALYVISIGVAWVCEPRSPRTATAVSLSEGR